jgi:hypothetical protein
MDNARLFFIWVSAQDVAVDHAVTDEEVGARDVEGRGEFRALCGVAFLPARDDQPPYWPCAGCLGVLRQRAVPQPQPQRRWRWRVRRARHARVGPCARGRGVAR